MRDRVRWALNQVVGGVKRGKAGAGEPNQESFDLETVNRPDRPAA